MNKEKMIELIEAELIKAEASQTNSEFEKHMYAIHTLTSLYSHSDSQSSAPSLQRKQGKQVTVSHASSSAQTVTDEEIRLMGGKVPSQASHASNTPSNPRMITDDALGNGESLFDF
ncbi:DUF5327 family protein [Staphylococcus hyicus]|uniref:DUF5327 family protein n=2 Tax=Staphylococcus hyicus TaxID=1284 RepID=A0ACD5FKB6_STAHY|nr:DUF5327 family protein [Staphylococcus hyicus]MDP4464079.1 DUF5327 family protein [Staphylococcus hyicus]MDP4467535.1 DUF5327 family protein [Staphylococcus hyicus]MDY3697307.1 DUF5327 family protein [Staphylococcus hyicus]NJH81338.1 hypothetical protein [Staphylococcus hyicus]RIO46806.1 hypothetical protein BUZ57_03620 [Staphylococcus hyicus]